MKMWNYDSPLGFSLVSFPVGPLQCNCALVWDRTSNEAILIDPGAEDTRIQKEIVTRSLKVKAILHTHAHFDHIGAADPLHRATEAPLYLHPRDAWLWENVELQGKMFGIPLARLERWQKDLKDDLAISLGPLELQTLFTPGHTPGSCCFKLGEILFSGDTLFQGSIGRTDLWGGDYDTIEASIRQRLYRLDDPTTVICGHGPNTTIEREKKSNPFVRASI